MGRTHPRPDAAFPGRLRRDRRCVDIEPLEPRVLLAADWTVMVYMAADNNLEAAALDDVNEMEVVGSLGGYVNILVQLDRSPVDYEWGDVNEDWSDTRRGRIIRDADPVRIGTPLLSIGEANMGNPATLSAFMQWGITTYPADRYMTVLWDHGGGTAGACWDDTDGGDWLTIPELSQAFAMVSQPMDIIGFDAALMSTVEVAYELRDAGSLMVASEELEPGDGWDYTAFLANMVAAPARPAVEVAADIVAGYGAFYGDSVTLATLDLTRIGAAGLAGALDAFATAIELNATPWDLERLDTHRSNARFFGDGNFRDLGSILADVAADSLIGAPIRQAGTAALVAYRQTVLNRFPEDDPSATGMSIYWQELGVRAPITYLGLNIDFLNHTQWNEFLGFWYRGLQPGRIEGGVWDDADGNGVWDAHESGLPGRTVFLDTNGDGLYDPTGRSTVAATDVPHTITDFSTVTSELAVSGIAGAITDLNVTLNIAHDYDRDLEVCLVSPSGTRVTLFNQVGGFGQNFTNTTLDDEAAIPIGSGTAPFLGSFRPQGYLSALDGQDPNGVWRLEISDNSAWFEGRLLSWSVTFDHGDLSTATDQSGRYNFGNLPPGPYGVYQVVADQWYQTAPDGGGYDLTVASGQTIAHIDFGNHRTVGRPDLLAQSDTGAFDNDNLTRLDNSSPEKRLWFSVSNTAPGATVYLYADGVLIGSAVAEPDTTSTIVGTSGEYDLVDGAHDIQASQTEPSGMPSGRSAPLRLTVDTIGPAMTVDRVRTADTTPPLSGTIDDPQATVAVTVGQTTAQAVNNGDGTWTLPDDALEPLTGGIYNVLATGTDLAGNAAGDGTTNELMLAVTIAQVTVPTSTDEGTLETFSVVAQDPQGQVITYTWNFGDGTPLVSGTDKATVQHAFVDNGAFTVTVTALVAGGQFDRRQIAVQVRNVAPTVVDIDVDNELLQQQPGSFLASVSDPGANDTLMYVWDFGDGTPTVSGVDLVSPVHVYAQAGLYQVTLSVTDDDGGVGVRAETIPVWHKVVATPAGRPLEFIDTRLNRVRVVLSGFGTAQAYFLSDINADLGRLVLSHTNERSVLSIAVIGSTRTTVGDIFVSASLGYIVAPQADLDGTIRVAHRLRIALLADVRAGSIIEVGTDLGQDNVLATDSVTIRLRRVEDLSVDANVLPIRSLTAVEWVDADGLPDHLEAAWIGRLTITGGRTPTGISAGDFQADLALSGTGLAPRRAALGPTFIRGSLEQADWRIAGRVAAITVRGAMTDVTIDVTPDPLETLNALALVNVLGLVSSSAIRATGDIGLVRAGAMHFSRVFAGVAQGVTGLPDPATEIFQPGSPDGQPAEIRAVVVRGLAAQGEYYSFVDSNIAAYRVGVVVMAHADFTSTGADFGLSAWEARSIRYIDRDTRQSWVWTGRHSQRVDPSTNFTVRLGMQGVGNFTLGERVSRDRVGDGDSLRTDLETVYLRTIGQEVLIGVRTVRPVIRTDLRLTVLLDTHVGPLTTLYPTDPLSDMLVELDLSTGQISLYQGWWPTSVVDPLLSAPSTTPDWVDTWHSARWRRLPTLNSRVMRTDEGFVLAIPKAALRGPDHIRVVSAALWSHAGAVLDAAPR